MVILMTQSDLYLIHTILQFLMKPVNLILFVKEMPEFPGGIPELMKYITDNVAYPEEAIKNNMQGRVVLKFVVNADGSVGRIQKSWEALILHLTMKQ